MNETKKEQWSVWKIDSKLGNKIGKPIILNGVEAAAKLCRSLHKVGQLYTWRAV